MKTSIIFLFILALVFESAIIFPQQSQYNRPQSSGNKKIYKQYQPQKSTLGKPANISDHKRKDFNVNRKEIVTKRNQRNTKNYSVSRERTKITTSENYFHIDRSGNSLWDGKH